MNGNKAIVIFGATGDLTYRKLLPSLFNLFMLKKLDETKIICLGRKDYSQKYYQNLAKKLIKKFSRFKVNDENLEGFFGQMIYHQMNITDIIEYQTLKPYLNVDEVVFYYAVGPSLFEIITDGIETLALNITKKVMVEKPFGTDLKQAVLLNEKLKRLFGDNNIYRIDHYLGKEMVQNIFIIRFKNKLFELGWNKTGVKEVEIVALEEDGILNRGRYYDETGALADMVQNHLLQILSLIAMDKPIGDETIVDKQLEVFKSLQPVEDIDVSKQVVLGQYSGYLNELHVDPMSRTETYAYLRLFIENENWYGVPFVVKTGKKMANRLLKIVVRFKEIDGYTDELTIHVQPKEGISFNFNIKEPGNDNIIKEEMDFCQSCNDIYKINTPEAYERLIEHCFENDQTWFSKFEQIYLSWEYIDKLKQKYSDEKHELMIY